MESTEKPKRATRDARPFFFVVGLVTILVWYVSMGVPPRVWLKPPNTEWTALLNIAGVMATPLVVIVYLMSVGMTRQQKILAILFFLFSGVAACRVFAFGLVVNAYGPCESRANGQLACLMYDGDNAHAYTFSGSMPLIMVMDSYIGTEADTNACALLDIDGC